MNIMTMKASRAMRAVDKAKAREAKYQEQRAGNRIRAHIIESTPWPVTFGAPRSAAKDFIRLIFAAWIIGIFVAIALMVGDRIVNSDAPAPASVGHTVELPL